MSDSLLGRVAIALLLGLVLVLGGLADARRREVIALTQALERCQAHAVECHWRSILPGTCDAGCP